MSSEETQQYCKLKLSEEFSDKNKSIESHSKSVSITADTQDVLSAFADKQITEKSSSVAETQQILDAFEFKQPLNSVNDKLVIPETQQFPTAVGDTQQILDAFQAKKNPIVEQGDTQQVITAFQKSPQSMVAQQVEDTQILSTQDLPTQQFQNTETEKKPEKTHKANPDHLDDNFFDAPTQRFPGPSHSEIKEEIRSQVFYSPCRPPDTMFKDDDLQPTQRFPGLDHEEVRTQVFYSPCHTTSFNDSNLEATQLFHADDVDSEVSVEKKSDETNIGVTNENNEEAESAEKNCDETAKQETRGNESEFVNSRLSTEQRCLDELKPKQVFELKRRDSKEDIEEEDSDSDASEIYHIDLQFDSQMPESAENFNQNRTSPCSRESKEQNLKSDEKSDVEDNMVALNSKESWPVKMACVDSGLKNPKPSVESDEETDIEDDTDKEQVEEKEKYFENTELKGKSSNIEITKDNLESDEETNIEDNAPKQSGLKNKNVSAESDEETDIEDHEPLQSNLKDNNVVAESDEETDVDDNVSKQAGSKDRSVIEESEEDTDIEDSSPLQSSDKINVQSDKKTNIKDEQEIGKQLKEKITDVNYMTKDEMNEKSLTSKNYEVEKSALSLNLKVDEKKEEIQFVDSDSETDIEEDLVETSVQGKTEIIKEPEDYVKKDVTEDLVKKLAQEKTINQPEVYVNKNIEIEKISDSVSNENKMPTVEKHTEVISGKHFSDRKESSFSIHMEQKDRSGDNNKLPAYNKGDASISSLTLNLSKDSTNDDNKEMLISNEPMQCKTSGTISIANSLSEDATDETTETETPNFPYSYFEIDSEIAKTPERQCSRVLFSLSQEEGFDYSESEGTSKAIMEIDSKISSIMEKSDQILEAQNDKTKFYNVEKKDTATVISDSDTLYRNLINISSEKDSYANNISITKESPVDTNKDLKESKIGRENTMNTVSKIYQRSKIDSHASPTVTEDICAEKKDKDQSGTMNIRIHVDERTPPKKRSFEEVERESGNESFEGFHNSPNKESDSTRSPIYYKTLGNTARGRPKKLSNIFQSQPKDSGLVCVELSEESSNKVTSKRLSSRISSANSNFNVHSNNLSDTSPTRNVKSQINLHPSNKKNDENESDFDKDRKQSPKSKKFSPTTEVKHDRNVRASPSKRSQITDGKQSPKSKKFSPTTDVKHDRNVRGSPSKRLRINQREKEENIDDIEVQSMKVKTEGETKRRGRPSKIVVIKEDNKNEQNKSNMDGHLKKSPKKLKPASGSKPDRNLRFSPTKISQLEHDEVQAKSIKSEVSETKGVKRRGRSSNRSNIAVDNKNEENMSDSDEDFDQSPKVKKIKSATGTKPDINVKLSPSKRSQSQQVKLQQNIKSEIQEIEEKVRRRGRSSNKTVITEGKIGEVDIKHSSNKVKKMEQIKPDKIGRTNPSRTIKIKENLKEELEHSDFQSESPEECKTRGRGRFTCSKGPQVNKGIKEESETNSNKSDNLRYTRKNTKGNSRVSRSKIKEEEPSATDVEATTQECKEEPKMGGKRGRSKVPETTAKQSLKHVKYMTENEKYLKETDISNTDESKKTLSPIAKSPKRRSGRTVKDAKSKQNIQFTQEIKDDAESFSQQKTLRMSKRSNRAPSKLSDFILSGESQESNTSISSTFEEIPKESRSKRKVQGRIESKTVSTDDISATAEITRKTKLNIRRSRSGESYEVETCHVETIKRNVPRRSARSNTQEVASKDVCDKSPSKVHKVKGKKSNVATNKVAERKETTADLLNNVKSTNLDIEELKGLGKKSRKIGETFESKEIKKSPRKTTCQNTQSLTLRLKRGQEGCLEIADHNKSTVYEIQSPPKKSKRKQLEAIEESPSKRSKRNQQMVINEESSSKKGNRKQQLKVVEESPPTRSKRKLQKEAVEESPSKKSKREQPKRQRKESLSSLDSSRTSTLSSSTSSTRTSKRSKKWHKEDDIIFEHPAERQSAASLKAKVLFTGFTDPAKENIVKELGGELVENVKDCTVLVADGVKRTCKLLAALGRGIPIVSTDWLIASKDARNFVDPWLYLVKDKDCEKKHVFNLQKTLAKASKNKLFEGYSFYATNSTKPPPDQLKEIIECAGGQVLSMPPKIFAEKLFIISCNEDKRRFNPFKKLKLPIVDTEFIMTGLLRHQILLEGHRLD